MKTLEKLVVRGISIISLLAPFSALAQLVPPAPPSPVQTFTGTGNSLTCLFARISSAFFWIIMAVAVIYVLLAAYKYLTAGGDETKVKEANNALLYAVIAIVVALIAKGFPSLIASVTNTSLGSLCSA